MRMVLGKSRINQNSFRIIVARPDEQSLSPDMLDRNPDRPETYPDGCGTSDKGLGRSWKCSRRFQNVPKPSRKVLEGPRSFWKVRKLYGRYHLLRPTLAWG